MSYADYAGLDPDPVPEPYGRCAKCEVHLVETESVRSDMLGLCGDCHEELAKCDCCGEVLENQRQAIPVCDECYRNLSDAEKAEFHDFDDGDREEESRNRRRDSLPCYPHFEMGGEA